MAPGGGVTGSFLSPTPENRSRFQTGDEPALNRKTPSAEPTSARDSTVPASRIVPDAVSPDPFIMAVGFAARVRSLRGGHFARSCRAANGPTQRSRSISVVKRWRPNVADAQVEAGSVVWVVKVESIAAPCSMGVRLSCDGIEASFTSISP
jgi:hypothetical protein